MRNLINPEWWKKAGIRALKTWAQAAASAIPTTAATLGEVNWLIVFSTATLSAIVSLLMNIGGLPELPES
jgi:alcohol dehydrogenase class IV